MVFFGISWDPQISLLSLKGLVKDNTNVQATEEPSFFAAIFASAGIQGNLWGQVIWSVLSRTLFWAEIAMVVEANFYRSFGPSVSLQDARSTSELASAFCVQGLAFAAFILPEALAAVDQHSSGAPLSWSWVVVVPLDGACTLQFSSVPHHSQLFHWHCG